MNRRKALTTIGMTSLAGTLLASCGKDQEPPQQTAMEPEPSADDGLVELLFVQEADGARYQNGQLTLTGLAPRTLFFADRPDDIAGYMTYQEYVDMVYEGPDNFEDDPPNATLIVVEGDKLAAVVLELSAKPRMEDNDMVFSSVKLIEGEPPVESRKAVLFIDTIGRPLSPGSVAGVHRRHRRRRRRVVG